MRAVVEKRFDAWIDWKFKKKLPEVCRWLKSHERKNICVDRICGEVEKMELSFLNASPEKNAKRLALLVDNAAKVFCNAAIDYHDTKMLSRNEIARRSKEYDREKEALDLAEENFLDCDDLDSERKRELDRMIAHKEINISELKK